MVCDTNAIRREEQASASLYPACCRRHPLAGFPADRPPGPAWLPRLSARTPAVGQRPAGAGMGTTTEPW